MIVILILSVATLSAQVKLVEFVNTLQGTASSFSLSRGNTYPTTAMPWGMNFWTPQTGENKSGWIYTYDAELIRGFRQTHQCSPWTNDYAAFSLMPVCGELRVFEEERAASFTHDREVAKPHLYRVQFDNGLEAAMAPTERGVFMNFDYPAGRKRYLVVDAFAGGSMVKIIPEERKIIGYSRKSNHSTPDNFTNYFEIRLDADISAFGTWDGKMHSLHEGSREAEGDHVGAFVELSGTDEVNVRTASSFISHRQAAFNLDRELSNAASIGEVSRRAADAWESQLGKVIVEGGTAKEKATFYSSLFRSMLFPRQFYEYDAGGDPCYYSPYDGEVHQGKMFTDTGFWDTFRSQFPLNAILHPAMHGDYIATLMDAYDQSGWLPSWSFPGHNGGMIGNHAFSLLADAWVKGFHTFDPQKALDAMQHDATHKGPKGPSIGRPAASEYFSLGYVPHDRSQAATREATAKTLEFAYNDFCAMTLAIETGNEEMADFFSGSIYNYRNVFDTSVRFMRGRLRDGSWDPEFTPIRWGDPFTEGNTWHYTWSVMHDVEGLISLLGGREAFVTKLDSVFSMPGDVEVGSYGHMIHEMTEMVADSLGQYAHGNQPIQHMPYLYNYAGAPWKTQYWVREIMDRLYGPGPDGFCGDEDQGGMSSWYVISAMGLYAVCPGTDQYVIGSPLFPKMTIMLENGNRLVIEAVDNSRSNVYIDNASLNGVSIDRNYLTYGEIMAGGTLRYRMSDKPNLHRGVPRDAAPFSVSILPDGQ